MTSPAEKEPFELFLQFSRSEFGDNAYVIPEESLEYQRTDLDGGKVSTASLPWNRATIKNGLVALQTEDAKSASILTTLGGELVCACLGSAPVKPGSHLGSVALAFHRHGIESASACSNSSYDLAEVTSAAFSPDGQRAYPPLALCACQRMLDWT